MHCHCGIAIDIVIGIAIGIDIDVIVTSAEDSSEPVGKEQCCRQQNMNYVIVALTAHYFEYGRSDNGVQSTMAEATISIDYMKHNLIRLIYSSIENTILEPYFHNI